MINFFTKFIGFHRDRISHKERLVSALGGFVGILIVFTISHYFLASDAILIIASMGASSVLVFAVPHGALSQPWSVAGGQIFSAIVGVTCAKLIPYPLVSAPLAVGAAIAVMHYTHCIHPPGGATALMAGLSSPRLEALGYSFVVTPVALNVVCLLLVAFAFNYLFSWRRYPASMHTAKPAVAVSKEAVDNTISQGDLVYALSQLDSFIDVTEHDLLRIYELATQSATHPSLKPEQIHLGCYYSNGRFGDEWAVRQVVDENRSAEPHKDRVIYKIVAGQGRRNSGETSRREFAMWARDQVARDEYYWKKVDAVEDPERAKTDILPKYFPDSNENNQ